MKRLEMKKLRIGESAATTNCDRDRDCDCDCG